MKIGLITIFNVTNYGAMLQCYALCNYLQGKGHEVILFDIPFLPQRFSWSFRILSKVKPSINKAFANQFLPKRTCNLDEQVDLYMVGSDQVWNPEITFDQWPRFMLDFAHPEIPKVAYGSSFGVSEWKDQSLKEQAGELLRLFKHITVRETSGVELLNREFGIKASSVLDPTFLIDSYAALMDNKGIKEDALASFTLFYQNSKWNEKAILLAKEMGCSFHSITASKYMECFPSYLRGVNLDYQPMRRWISEIVSARYVLTDSFHCMLLALLHQRQFVVISSSNSRMTRFVSLLSQLGLEDRIATSMEDAKPILLTSIDYDIVTPVIDKLKVESKLKLEELLSL